MVIKEEVDEVVADGRGRGNREEFLFFDGLPSYAETDSENLNQCSTATQNDAAGICCGGGY